METRCRDQDWRVTVASGRVMTSAEDKRPDDELRPHHGCVRFEDGNQRENLWPEYTRVDRRRCFRRRRLHRNRVLSTFAALCGTGQSGGTRSRGAFDGYLGRSIRGRFRRRHRRNAGDRKSRHASVARKRVARPLPTRRSKPASSRDFKARWALRSSKPVPLIRYRVGEKRPNPNQDLIPTNLDASCRETKAYSLSRKESRHPAGRNVGFRSIHPAPERSPDSLEPLRWA